MKILKKETWNLIRQRWYHVFLFELLYRGLTCPIYLRLANRGVQFALQMAGYSYLTEENLRGFLLQPWTWVMLMLIGFVGMLRMTVEIAGLMTAYQGSATLHKLAPFPVLWGALQKTSGLLMDRNWLLGAVLLLDDLVLNLLWLVRMFIHVKPASFVAQEIRQRPAYLMITILLVVLLVLVVFPTVFAGFSCMMDGLSFRNGMRRSRRLVLAHWNEVVSSVLILNLILAGTAFVLYGLGVAAAAVFVTIFTKRSLAMAVLLTVTDRLEAIGLMAAWTICTTVNFALLSVLYKKYMGYGAHSTCMETDALALGNQKHRRIAIGVTVLTGLSLFYIFTLVRNGFTFTDGLLTEVQITAHRGSSRQAPENTIAAFEAAMDEMADMAELDVQLTADGEVVLGHDATLKRVAGINRSIGSMTWKELQQVDVGSWFSEAFAGERIPRLADVMESCKGRLDLNIELKNIGSSELPDKVADLIREYEMEEQCVVTSTSLNYLRRIEELLPQVRTGYIVAASYGKVYAIEDIDFISIRAGFVNRSLVEQMHEQGKAVHAWTVNSKSEVERLCLLGVDNIITDYPAMAREIAYRDEATETLLEYLRMVFR